MNDTTIQALSARRRLRETPRRALVIGLAALMVATNLWVPPAQAAARPEAAAQAEADKVTKVRAVTPQPARMPDGTRGRGHKPKPALWPAAITSTVDLPTGSPARAASAGTGTWVRVGAVLVAAGSGPEVGNTSARAATSRLRVQVLDAAAVAVPRAVRPAVVRLSRADGSRSAAPVDVRIEYGGFEDAYGGDWANRLRLGRLPECALTTPSAAACRATPLVSRNDPVTKTVTASVSAIGGAGALVALMSGGSSGAGDFGATPLASSSTWSAGGSSGDFSWSYAMRVPPSANGPAPGLVLAYSAQSVDGRHAASNNQPSMIGEGFEFTPGGSIERRYVPCARLART